MDVTPPTKGVQALLADDGDRTDGHTHAGRRTQAACACTCDVRTLSHGSRLHVARAREGDGTRQKSAGEGMKAGRGPRTLQDKQGRGPGVMSPEGERGGHVASRRSSLSAAPDRSLRSCGGPPTTPTVDAVIGDAPAVRVVAARSGRSRSPRRER